MLNVFLVVGVVQLVAAVAVIAVLRHLLDRELLEAALEKIQVSVRPEWAGEVAITSAKPLSAQHRSQFEGILRRKSPAAAVRFEHDPGVQGGVVIRCPEGILDFSLADRLKKMFNHA